MKYLPQLGNSVGSFWSRTKERERHLPLDTQCVASTDTCGSAYSLNTHTHRHAWKCAYKQMVELTNCSFKEPSQPVERVNCTSCVFHILFSFIRVYHRRVGADADCSPHRETTLIQPLTAWNHVQQQKEETRLIVPLIVCQSGSRSNSSMEKSKGSLHNLYWQHLC